MAPIVRRTLVRLPAVQYAADPATSAMPLAEHGDWQAFFDDDRYCLVYYFNTQTGTSQWEPPPNFPIPAVRAGEDGVATPSSTTQPVAHRFETQQRSEREDVVVASTEEKKEDSAFGWLFKGAIRVASDMIEKQQEEEKKEIGNMKQKESKPWWSFLVDDDDEKKVKQSSDAVVANAQSKQQQQQKPSFWDNFFRKNSSNKEETKEDPVNVPTETVASAQVQHAVAPLHSMRTMQQQHTEWLKFLDNGETNPTIPLVPPSEREAKLQQKLYADSLARQDNLRRNYKAVQEHRSKTFSLSALKRNDSESKEWYQYLGK